MKISIDHEKIAELCKRNHIRKMSFFGSVLRDDFRKDSDVDVLVEFEPGQGPGFIRLLQIEAELSCLLEGRKIDLITPGFLNYRIKQKVLDSAEVQYAA